VKHKVRNLSNVAMLQRGPVSRSRQMVYASPLGLLLPETLHTIDHAKITNV